MSPEEQRRVHGILENLNATQPCVRCGSEEFGVAGYSVMPMWEGSPPDTFRGTHRLIPIVIIACNNCGAVTEHLLGKLGILPREG